MNLDMQLLVFWPEKRRYDAIAVLCSVKKVIVVIG